MPAGTPGSLSVRVVKDQPPSPTLFPPTLCTQFFPPTTSLGAFLQTLEECKSPAGPRGAPSHGVWAPLSRQKNQAGLVPGSNTHPSNSRSPALSPTPPGGASTTVCPSESGQWTHHGVMEEQLPGLVKFLITQHVHKIFEEITWDQRDCEQRRGPGGAAARDTRHHPSRVCTHRGWAAPPGK